MFITFEGPEGAGKTTQIARLQRKLSQHQITSILVREPGGTRIGDQIRKLLLDPSYQEMSITTELFLYAASRAQLVEQIIHPALQKGQVVLCDRFLDSSLVYQGLAAGEDIHRIQELNRLAVQDVHPHRTYLIDVPCAIGLRRSGEGDRMERKGRVFHERVRNGYHQVAKLNPDRIRIIDGTQPVSKVSLEIWEDFQRIAGISR